MRVITESDKDQNYIEIHLTENDLNKILMRKFIVEDFKVSFGKKLLGICIRRDDDAISKRKESKIDF